MSVWRTHSLSLDLKVTSSERLCALTVNSPPGIDIDISPCVEYKRGPLGSPRCVFPIGRIPDTKYWFDYSGLNEEGLYYFLHVPSSILGDHVVSWDEPPEVTSSLQNLVDTGVLEERPYLPLRDFEDCVEEVIEQNVDEFSGDRDFVGKLATRILNPVFANARSIELIALREAREAQRAGAEPSSIFQACERLERNSGNFKGEAARYLKRARSCEGPLSLPWPKHTESLPIYQIFNGWPYDMPIPHWPTHPEDDLMFG